MVQIGRSMVDFPFAPSPTKMRKASKEKSQIRRV